MNLADALVHVDGNTDRPQLFGDPPLDGLLDPPVRVGRELESALGVELLGGPEEPDVPLLNEVHEGKPALRVPLRDVNDQTKVREDELVPCGAQCGVMRPNA